MIDFQHKSLALALLTFVFACDVSMAQTVSATEMARPKPKRFTVPGAVAVSLAHELLNSPHAYARKRGERAAPNAVYCPGSDVGYSTKCTFKFMPPKKHWHDCARVAPGWKVIDVRINGTPKQWVSRTWKSDPRCLTAEFSVKNTNSNQRNFSVARVILEGPYGVTNYREAFDY